MRLIKRLVLALVAVLSLSLMVAVPAAAASITTHTSVVWAVTAAGEASPAFAIEIPAIPAGVLTLLQFVAPYAIAIVQNPRWSATQKKIVAIVASVLLTAIVLVVAVVGFGLPVGSWWAFGLLGVVVSQTSYSLVTGSSARNLSYNAGVGRV